MSNPLNCWAQDMVGTIMVLKKGCDVPDGEPRNPQMEFVVKDGWQKYCVRQGKGKFIRLDHEVNTVSIWVNFTRMCYPLSLVSRR